VRRPRAASSGIDGGYAGKDDLFFLVSFSLNGVRVPPIGKVRWRSAGSKGSAIERINAMNETTNEIDRSGEETLTGDVSDEALEAAAGVARGVVTGPYDVCNLSLRWAC
jgi:hypothetical protein